MVDEYEDDIEAEPAQIKLDEPVYTEVIRLNSDGTFNAEEVDHVDTSAEEYQRALAVRTKLNSAKQSGAQSFVVYFTGYYTGNGNPHDVSFEIDIDITINDTMRTIAKKINDAKKEIEYREPNLATSGRRGVSTKLSMEGEKPKTSYRASMSGGKLRRSTHRPYIGSGGGQQGYL